MGRAFPPAAQVWNDPHIGGEHGFVEFVRVVDDEKTGKALLERGQLRRRVTLIPLNKVRAGRLDDKRCARAASVAKKAGGSARIALEFVGHEAHVKNAVEYAFGGALVCDSMDVARAVAFDAGVKARCVTLDGDVCDPRGSATLEGRCRAGLGRETWELA